MADDAMASLPAIAPAAPSAASAERVKAAVRAASVPWYVWCAAPGGAIVSTRLGMAWGEWMRRIRR